MPPLATRLLRSCLLGMEALYDRVTIEHWRLQVRGVLDLRDPVEMAAGYRLISQGSASGTMYDLIISERNRHPISEQQEPWVNELLTTFESIAALAAETIEGDGADAKFPMAPSVAARHTAWLREARPMVGNRTDVIVYAVRCTTCESRFMVDTSVALAAARRWSLDVAPPRIAAGRSLELVAIAFDAEHDPEAKQALEIFQPAADALGLPAIRLPYNGPAGRADDRCAVCGADTWKPVLLRLLDDPVRFIPLA